MTQGSGPQTTSVGFTRLGRESSETVSELGPLADLVGTWMGSHGWELIALPAGPPGGNETFRLLIRPYIEIVTFATLGAPVPNRGGPKGDIFITGLEYSMRITDAETNEPLHLESGMWLLLDDQGTVARQASIPHGDVLLALGTAVTEPGPPSIPALSTLPDAGPKMPLGYTDAYLQPVDGFSPTNANAVLSDVLADQKVVKTTTLPVSTQSGGIANIPFVTANANATAFSCAYWIETVEDPTTGTQFSQLQYSQQTNIEFLPQFGNPGALIMWPHVNVNTLLKQ